MSLNKKRIALIATCLVLAVLLIFNNAVVNATEVAIYGAATENNSEVAIYNDSSVTTEEDVEEEIAEEEVEEEIEGINSLSQLHDLIPEELEIDIPEVEFKNAESAIINEVKKILDKEEIKYEMDGNIILLSDIKIDGCNIEISSYSPYVYDTIYMSAVYFMGYKDNAEELCECKQVRLKYNNCEEYSKADEEYVRNLKIDEIDYFPGDISLFGEDFDVEDQFDIIADAYSKSINDSTITILADSGMGGMCGLNLMADDVAIGIFRNGILYEVRTLDKTAITIPVINVTDSMTDEEISKYAMELLKKYYPEYSKNATKIGKGMKDLVMLEDMNLDIPNAYTVYVEADPYSYGCIIINKSTAEDKVATTNTETNVKLEATGDVVPTNTVLEVENISEGQAYKAIEKALPDVVGFKAFDITLKSDGVSIQPNGKVKINLPIPEGFDKSDLAVFWVEEGKDSVKYDTKIIEENGKKYAQFETDHFSYYVLAQMPQVDDSPNMGVSGSAKEVSAIMAIISLVAIAAIVIKK